jgi:hypothetical protein
MAVRGGIRLGIGAETWRLPGLLADLFLVDVAEQPEKPFKLGCHDACLGIGRIERFAQALKLLCELERQLDAGKVHPAPFDQVFHLTEPFDILVRVQPKVAGRPGWSDQTFTLILAERLRVHLDEPGRDADDKQWF